MRQWVKQVVSLLLLLILGLTNGIFDGNIIGYNNNNNFIILKALGSLKYKLNHSIPINLHSANKNAI